MSCQEKPKKNPEEKPKVSVVMAVYNSSQLLIDTIDSVLSQQGVELEFIIIDDGSDKPVGDILLGISDPRIKLFRQENQGLTKSLIKGCDAATADFIARIDVGDQMMPNRLYEQAKLLKADRTISLVCSPVRLTTEEGYPLIDIDYSPESLHEGLTQPNSILGDSPFHASVMFRSDLYQKVGGYRKEFYLAQDLDLWSRLIENGKVAVIDKVLTVGVFLPNGLSARYAAKQDQFKAIVTQLISVRENNEDESDLLKQAEQIRISTDDNEPDDLYSGNYFIGRCLLKARHSGARRYLSRALRARFWSLRTWWSLIQSLFYREAK